MTFVQSELDILIYWIRQREWGWVFKDWKHLRAWVICNGWFYVFRNLPGVIKWQKGRLLPRRWGFGIAGLIEFGDRG
jgi:hypothetical protein